MNHRFALLFLLTLAGLLPNPVQAAVRAWLDHNPVDLGENVTLNIEAGVDAARVDFSPLRADFEIVEQSSSQQMQLANGKTSMRTLYAVALRPKHAGKIRIPSLRIGAENSPELEVTVRGVAAPPVVNADADTVLEVEVDNDNPYVQQTVGVTLRFFYAVALASGQLDLDAPDGASLQRVGEDRQSVRERNGRRYNMVERQFLLVPERSGTLTLPAPRFIGRGVSGWIDDFLGGRSEEIRAVGTPRVLQVRAQPADAPQPWLPLRSLRLRYVSAPQEIRAGEAATLTIEAVAEGATRSQLPDLPVPSVAGAQVFAEPVQYQESFRNGIPQVKLVRSYSLVAATTGTLRISGVKMPWWDARAAVARQAALPDMNVKVLAGGSAGVDSLPDAGTSAGTAFDVATASGDGGTARIPANVWTWLAVFFAVLWLATLIWAVWRRSAVALAETASDAPRQLPARTLSDLRKVLDTGTLDEVGEVLCAMSVPSSADLDALIARLDAAEQREAVEAMRRARWAEGDGTAARAALRAAFHDGPKWKTRVKGGEEILPPLYPE